MSKYSFDIVQTNRYEVIIEADSEEQALEFFGDYITDDFGDPYDSHLEYVVNFYEDNGDIEEGVSE